MTQRTAFRPCPRLISCFFIACCAVIPAALAQETTAGLQGYVKDQSGAVVPKATVEATSPALIGSKKTEADGVGYYRFTNLPPGEYTLDVTASGFRAYRQIGIVLEVGRLPNIDVQLQVGAVTQVVEVTQQAPLVDTAQSKVAVTVEHQMLESLPKGRSFQSMIPFAPGARQEPLQSTTGSRDNGFEIDGASDSENVYLIDGMNTTNIQNGGVGKNFQMDFIQEVQIKSSSFEAEHGGALGGVVNVVPKHGSNAWHGSAVAYLRSNGFNANDACASGYTSSGFSTVCGLRLNPNLASLSSSTRLDGTPEYYVPKKDFRQILERGFELGGPAFKDRLWVYTSYIPASDRITRTTTFTDLNPGPRALTQRFTQHNAYTRLDYRMFNALRLFAGWNYAYSRTEGQLGDPDSAFGQLNDGASTDPNTLSSKFGSVNPLAFYNFGGDWSPTSKLVVSVRYGYMFSNNEERGRPVGTRYLYQTTVNAASRDLAGAPFPASARNTRGFANIPSNRTFLFDAYKRNTFNGDASYFLGHFLGGAHILKGGYAWMRQSNNVFRDINTAAVDLNWAVTYSPVTNNTACDTVIAQNVANGLPGSCRGRYGYFIVGTTVTNLVLTGTDKTSSTDKTYSQALYIQDAWTVGHGLTLNLGVRFDQERLPPYDPKRFPTVRFGWGDKIAPRIGGAYDLLHNGKVKVYASYGKFYDIMKMGLSRGSFGSDYWHNCVYAMDFTDYTTITPTFASGGGCPASGPAPGVTVGRFIENVDFRATKEDPRDPAIASTMKPMLQHEIVTGVDWAINPTWSLETRYARKRLDRTIEDMSITDNLGFYIGNPGTPFADVLHRQVIIPDPNNAGQNILVGPFCAECPGVVPAIRRYDAVEFRLARRPGAKWFGAVSYTYSKLTGNYSGLTDTDPTDGGGGRHAPNNHRAFDLPTMTYLPNGQIDDGPLSTDRPHTAKLYGFYRLKWLGQQTLLGFTQAAYQGSPVSTCLPVIGSASACQWAEGRGNLVQFHRAANGDLVSDGVVQGARTDPYFQTDFSFRHEFPVSRKHENYRLSFEASIFNLFNQHAAVAIAEGPLASGTIKAARSKRFPGDPGFDWNTLMTGYNYASEINQEAKPPAQGGLGTNLTLASRYGLPQVFQGARNMRFMLKFVF